MVEDSCDPWGALNTFLVSNYNNSSSNYNNSSSNYNNSRSNYNNSSSNYNITLNMILFLHYGKKRYSIYNFR